MHAPSALAALVGSLCIGGSFAFAQGQLWIVDQAGGPGFDFTEIQPAVDAAANGDTVLVRGGTYAGFTIDGKSLVVTADAAGPAGVAHHATVRALPATRQVVLRGLILAQECRLEDNDGTVWLEALTVQTGFGDAGLSALQCSTVIASRCDFNGPFGGWSALGPGIDASDSSLYLFETNARGTSFAFGSGPGVGGNGVNVTNSFLFASGCTFQGGQGGSGGACSPGDAGGNGLVRIGGSTPQLLGTDLVSGAGGCAVDCTWDCGPPGTDAVGGFELVAGFPREYVLASPAAGGQPTAVHYSGKAGDLVFSLIGVSPAALYLPQHAGPLVLPIPPLIHFHGAADGSGQLQAVVNLPLLPLGLEALTVYAQSAAISASGAAVLGAPSQLSIL